MIIDFHTHAFPEAIAQKALQKLSFVSGGLKYYTDGTLSSPAQCGECTKDTHYVTKKY